MVLGELKTKCSTPATNLVPEKAADGYKLFYEMAASYKAHEAFWKVPPPYVFGLHQAHRTWRLFAMGADLEPVEMAVFHVHNVVDCIYLAQVCRRLGTHIKHALLSALEVDESKVRAFIAQQHQQVREERKKKSRAHSDKNTACRQDEEDQPDETERRVKCATIPQDLSANSARSKGGTQTGSHALRHQRRQHHVGPSHGHSAIDRL
jgi:hypothetical protein